jgi:hypothetical protein
MRGLCYRTIAEVRQRQRQQQQQQEQASQPQQPQQQQEQEQALQPQQPQQGVHSPATNGVADRVLTDDGAAGPGAGSSPGSKQQRSRGMLPFGGFIGHLLECDNPIVGRPFTDLEVVLPKTCAIVILGMWCADCKIRASQR